MPADLIAAYLRTTYRLPLGGATIDLKIGELSPELDALLDARGATRWAWLTATNPRSVLLPAEENRRRTAVLAAALAEERWTLLPGVAIDPSGEWPDELSHFVLEPDLTRLRALAEEFDQNAYLAGERGGAPRLILLNGD